MWLQFIKTFLRCARLCRHRESFILPRFWVGLTAATNVYVRDGSAGGTDGCGISLHISVADSASYLDVLELKDALEVLAATCNHEGKDHE